METYEVVVYEYGAKRVYSAPNKEEALKLYQKYSQERPGNVKIIKKTKK
jgi:hypothetical protein